MGDVLKDLYKKRVFTLSEAVALSSALPSSVSKMLSRYAGQGVISQIRRNLYCANDMSSDCPLADRYEIASALSPTSYISYHTALEFHGIAHQVFYKNYVVSETLFNNFEFYGYGYIYCRDTIGDIGVMSPLANPKIKVTDKERTIIDCIDRIDRAGGIEELLHCLESVYMLDESKLLAYLDAYGKAFLFQKTGYILERLKEQISVSEHLISHCLQMSKSNVKFLTNDSESDTYISKWKLYVPKSIIHNAEEYELI